METYVREQLNRIKFFDVNPDLSSLNENEKEALNLCVQASRILDNLYLRQVCGDKLESYLETIENDANRKELQPREKNFLY